MKKINNKIKLSLIIAGSILVIGSPIIIFSSIYISKNISPSKTLIELNNFYDREEGMLFAKENFKIWDPSPTSGQYLVENVIPNNIQFSKINQLNNFSYEMEIINIIPNVVDGSLKFRYKISSLIDTNVSIIRESSSYNNYENAFGVLKKFDI